MLARRILNSQKPLQFDAGVLGPPRLWRAKCRGSVCFLNVGVVASLAPRLQLVRLYPPGPNGNRSPHMVGSVSLRILEVAATLRQPNHSCSGVFASTNIKWRSCLTTLSRRPRSRPRGHVHVLAPGTALDHLFLVVFGTLFRDSSYSTPQANEVSFLFAEAAEDPYTSEFDRCSGCFPRVAGAKG